MELYGLLISLIGGEANGILKGFSDSGKGQDGFLAQGKQSMVARLGGPWPKAVATQGEERPAGDLLQAMENLTELPKGKKTMVTKQVRKSSVCYMVR